VAEPTDAPREESEYAKRPCIGCGRVHLLKVDERCPWCAPPNPFGTGPLAMLVDAGGEDSPHPERQRDGTAIYNVGLPPIDLPDGTCRPISNAELGSNRGVREYAKRTEMEPMNSGRWRGVAGR
jgi:hypothetical protein